MTERNFSYATFFSGLGGSACGLSMAGGHGLMALDLEDNSIEHLKLNFPELEKMGAILQEDIRKVSAEEMLKIMGIKPGDLFLYQASAPCQTFSMSNTTGGEDVEKDELFLKCIQDVSVIRPSVVCFENVPGMMKKKSKRKYLYTFINELRRVGYRTNGFILKASGYGAVQTRPRLWILGIREDLGVDPSVPPYIDKVVGLSDIFPYLNGHQLDEWDRDFIPGNAPFSTLKTTPGMKVVECGIPRLPIIEELRQISSFPASYQFTGTYNQIHARLGNAVLPLQMKVLAEHLYDQVMGTVSHKDNEPLSNEICEEVSTVEEGVVEEALNTEDLRHSTDDDPSRFTLSSIEDLLALTSMMDEEKETFLKTGYDCINRLTKGANAHQSGGWRPESLYTVMGPSGYGKSIFLANFARDSWAEGLNVLYISTEMGHVQTYERILKSYFEVDSTKDLAAAAQQKELPTGKIEIRKVMPNATSCTDIQAIINGLSWKPDVMYIDYADELIPESKNNSLYAAQGEVYTGLKTLAEENHLPVITATQTNRVAEDSKKGGTKKWVGMSAVADSSKKIRLVDMLLSITQSVEDKQNSILNLQVVKNRYGESKVTIPFRIDYQKMLLEEILDEESAQSAA